MRRTKSARRSGEAPSLSASGAWLVACGAMFLFAALAARIGWLALDGRQPAAVAPSQAASGRAEIVDRNGNLLAVTVPVLSLHANPREIGDPSGLADSLAGIFGNLDRERLESRLARDSHFEWVSRRVTPAQKRAVLALGSPGLYFGRREVRLYPVGRQAAHIVGGVRMDNEGVERADLIGVAGVEGHQDERLRGSDQPLRLTIDLPIQNALHETMLRSMREQRAKGAAAVLMEVGTGAVRAMVSLPDFDPNHRSAAKADAKFNRAAQGVYEFGSVFKPLTLSLALETGVADMHTMFDISAPLRIDGHRIRDPYINEKQISLHEAVYRSSNIATAKVALAVGGPKQRKFLKSLGLFEPLPLELLEASGSQPLYPSRWRPSITATVAFGHGIAITPVHLAAGYAAIVGDGRRVLPTLVEGAGGRRERVVSEATVEHARSSLRSVVERGTGRRLRVSGYRLGGKTGTADKVAESGRGYSRDRVQATFVAVFPGDRPTHVLVVTLDEPQGREMTSARYRRVAGNTAAPAAARAIRRIGPLLGMLPRPPAPPSEQEMPSEPELKVARPVAAPVAVREVVAAVEEPALVPRASTESEASPLPETRSPREKGGVVRLRVTRPGKAREVSATPDLLVSRQ